MNKNKIDKKYKWNLKDIYENEEKLKEDIKECEKLLSYLDEYKEKINISSDMLFGVYELMEKIETKLIKIQAYAMLNYHMDMSDSKASKLYNEVEDFLSKAKIANSFVEPEITNIEEEKLRDFFNQDERLKKYEKYNNFITYIPSLLTSLGIFGTFVGISIGLVNFDPANIDKSISELLEGMKTAFYSSLVGVFFSICFKIFLSYVKSNEIDTDDDEQILKLIERQTVSIENVTKILGGDSDTSVLTQIKLFKSDINDYINYTKNFNDKFALTLWDKMENFADILSKSATETARNENRGYLCDTVVKTFGSIYNEFLPTKICNIQENGVGEAHEVLTRQGACPTRGGPPLSWEPHVPFGLLLSS